MNFVIIVAAGKGKRMNSKENKVFIPLLDKPMLYHALKPFQNCNEIDEIIIVTQKLDFNKIKEIKNRYSFDKIKNVVEGGKERQDSVHNGLMSIKSAKDDDIILVHNGSNPLVKENEIIECINAAKKFGAAVCCFPLKDTIKKINNDFVEKTLDRKDVYQMQTPQAAKYGLFVEGFKNIKKNGIRVTDDVSIVESIGQKVKTIECSYENIKLTARDDLNIAEGIIMRRNNASNDFRVGFGQDSHKFSNNKNKRLILGGYTVPNETGLEANSDGDLILHALFNALSSAIGEDSLGHYADPMLKRGVTDSRKYLKVILDKLDQKNIKISNVSIGIEAYNPRLDSHTPKIRESLSKILSLDKERIGITCTSGEQLTSFGQGIGMQCFCVVSIVSQNPKI
ncbi:2-C-methyl-D-erythritol 4-phosphate cytidylyltransferase [Candidatus Woesearchaeota archaeon]|nr:2-C-methyl-D-erythritol 4-phosphate cytidylyltransferase [Candidatus Woesearchaeota archaeon]